MTTVQTFFFFFFFVENGMVHADRKTALDVGGLIPLIASAHYMDLSDLSLSSFPFKLRLLFG